MMMKAKAMTKWTTTKASVNKRCKDIIIYFILSLQMQNNMLRLVQLNMTVKYKTR